MSRYAKKVDNAYTLNWGYDNPLKEYFIELLDSEGEHVCALGTNVCLMPMPESPRKMKYSKAEIQAVFNRYAEYIPEAHLSALALDLPF